MKKTAALELFFVVVFCVFAVKAQHPETTPAETKTNWVSFLVGAPTIHPFGESEAKGFTEKTSYLLRHKLGKKFVFVSEGQQEVLVADPNHVEAEISGGLEYTLHKKDHQKTLAEFSGGFLRVNGHTLKKIQFGLQQEIEIGHRAHVAVSNSMLLFRGASKNFTLNRTQFSAGWKSGKGFILSGSFQGYCGTQNAVFFIGEAEKIFSKRWGLFAKETLKAGHGYGSAFETGLRFHF